MKAGILTLVLLSPFSFIQTQVIDIGNALDCITGTIDPITTAVESCLNNPTNLNTCLGNIEDLTNEARDCLLNAANNGIGP
ncbi:unnamed protein product [Cunninghamella echinulata]